MSEMQMVPDHHTGRPINRIVPKLGPGAYQTYAIVNPLQTHYRKASCKEVSCLAYANGWKSRFDVGTADGRQKANWVRLFSKKHFAVTQLGDIVTFEFSSGQQCPQEHKVRLERDPLFVKVGGNWRGRIGEPSIMKPADWVDDFAGHQQGIADAHKRG